MISAFAFFGHPLVQALLPVVALLLLAPVAVRVFRRSWLSLDQQARAEYAARGPRDHVDARAPAVFVIAGVCLTLQKYYGNRDSYYRYVQGAVARQAEKWPGLRPDLFDELYSQVWWSIVNVAGYMVIPLLCWRLFFPRDSWRDLGLRWGGLWRHGWLYVGCLLVVLPMLFFVAKQPDFGAYYPFYELASRSWFDLLAWEVLYVLQFFALEFFFRGWWLAALRPSLGASAIFSMLVPYCLIHHGKPYLETNGALLAGLVLGTLALQARSIYGGFLVHAVIAISMDVLALRNRHAWPSAWGPW